MPDLQAVAELLQNWEQGAKVLGIKALNLINPPGFYDWELNELLNKALDNNGFRLSFSDLNFHLPIDRPFAEHLHRSERWKLNKLIREGFLFKPISPPEWDLAYPILLDSRVRKGYQLSMTRQNLEDIFDAFPQNYGLFGIFKKSECVAVAVSIKVGSGIEYVFYTADKLSYRKWSPVVMLHQGLYDVAQNNGAQFLDLGTASLRGIVNEGVACFKSNLGGQTSLKSSWAKIIN